MIKSGSNLEKILNKGIFAVTGELGPPRGADINAIREKAKHLKGMVDAVNITDNQTAVVRMASWAASLIALQEGLEPNYQMVCRDRNRIAMQSDILGAYTLGIRNILCLSGDHPVFGDHPFTRKVFALLTRIATKPLAHAGALFKIMLALITGKAHISGGVYLNLRKKQWESGSDSYPFLFAYRKHIRQKSGYRFSLSKRTWLKPDGSFPQQNRCTHLHEKITEKFGLTIPGTDWQHWNGGVFLFDRNSADFMDEWHRKTMEIFADNEWKVRDQGTLIATVVSRNLTRHPTLPEEYNFIADFYKPEIVACHKQPGTFRKGNKIIRPAFVHVYHHFGDNSWDVWKHIESLLPQQKKEEDR